MRKKILITLFAVSMSIFTVGFICIMGVMYGFLTDQYLAELKSEAQYLRSTFPNEPSEFFEDAHSRSLYRITLIDSTGKVLYDNQKDVSSLENHRDREEFQEASEKGEGFSYRYSITTSSQTINYAMLLPTGEVLRVSETFLTVSSMRSSLIPIVILVAVSSALLSLILSTTISESIMAPLNAIDLDNPDEEKVYGEMVGLVRRLREQNEEIDRQMDKIRSEHDKQDRIRREFTANVSHELKTPLTSISGYAELIRDGIARSEDVKDFAGNIYDEARRLITLVGEIIKLSQFDERAVKVKNEPIDLYESCYNVLSELETVAGRLGVECILTGESCVINGAETVVEEIIYNLVDNAIKYNLPGGKVEVEVKPKDLGALLTVKDTGIGIPAEEKDRVFERFYRVNKSHSKEINGTGLGLSIVKHAAAYLNAEIKLESEQGKGTNISIFFPLKQ